MSDIGAILETGGAAVVEFAASQIAEHGGKTAQCANCHEPLLGPYCAVCGQPRDVHRRSVGHLLKDFFADIASFDSRILRTARALLVQPGELSLAYHQGRTQPYVPPVRLYLFVTLLFFLLLSVTHIALVQVNFGVTNQRFFHDQAGHVTMLLNGKATSMPLLHSDAAGNVSAGGTHITEFKADGSRTQNVSTTLHFFQPIGANHVALSPEAHEQLEKSAHEPDDLLGRGIIESLLKLEKDPAALNGPLTEWMPRVLFLLLPLFAVLLSLFYRRQRKSYYFVDHLVFSLNFHSFAFIALLAAAALNQLVQGGVIGLFILGVIGLYLALAMKRFYGQSVLWTGLKFLCVYAIYLVFILLPAFVGLLAASVFYG